MSCNELKKGIRICEPVGWRDVPKRCVPELIFWSDRWLRPGKQCPWIDTSPWHYVHEAIHICDQNVRGCINPGDIVFEGRLIWGSQNICTGTHCFGTSPPPSQIREKEFTLHHCNFTHQWERTKTMGVEWPEKNESQSNFTDQGIHDIIIHFLPDSWERIFITL